MNSLEQTGINPRRNPRHFKDAELRTRKILKLLGAVQSYIHPEDESQFRAVVRRVSEINDGLLSAILTKTKK
jgi:hypothetical protein